MTAPTPLTPNARSSSLKRDAASAYIAAGTKIVCWAWVSALVYRFAGPAHLAALALIRATIGILSYTSVGLTPAMVWRLAKARALSSGRPKAPGERPTVAASAAQVFSTGVLTALATSAIGLGAAIVCALVLGHRGSDATGLVKQIPLAVLLLGGATLVRLLSDIPGAVLQTSQRIALDNFLLAGSDLLHALALLALWRHASLLSACWALLGASLSLAAARFTASARFAPGLWPPRLTLFRRAVAWELLAFGSLVLVAQISEYLYAPTDYLLIHHFFTARELAAYAPGVQIDGALLALVAGLAAVLLPRSAVAHAAGDTRLLMRYYRVGTLVSTGLLMLGAIGVWLCAPLLLKVWFGPNPPATRAILDLVLVGTVVGGSSGVGRAILFGIGRLRAYTMAALIAGCVNVLVSYGLVRWSHLGLRGILYGTLVAVIGRCGLWVPWYVPRCLRQTGAGPGDQNAGPAVHISVTPPGDAAIYP